MCLLLVQTIWTEHTVLNKNYFICDDSVVLLCCCDRLMLIVLQSFANPFLSSACSFFHCSNFIESEIGCKEGATPAKYNATQKKRHFTFKDFLGRHSWGVFFISKKLQNICTHFNCPLIPYGSYFKATWPARALGPCVWGLTWNAKLLMFY